MLVSEKIQPQIEISFTQSLCPVCLKVLSASLVKIGEEIHIRRQCPEHGLFSEPIWRGRPLFDTWHRPKGSAKGVPVNRPSIKGCPYDCGLCPSHSQHPCTILLEITSRCDLMCSVCFASSGGLNSTHRDFELLKKDLKIIKAQAPRVVLQLSGGEPSLHPNLIELVYEAASIFPGVQLNTNGLNLAKDKSLARELKKAGLKWVFLQFDSLNDEVYRLLRGRALVETKLKALENLEAAKLPAVLVPTVVRGLNHGELGELIRLAASKAWLRGVHFQPMTASGRNSFLGPQYRLTLPELLTLLQEQGCGTIDIDKAFPPGCEHERCSFHLRFRRLNDGTLIPKTALASSNCCSEGANDKSAPLESQDGQSRDRAVDIILRSWAPGQNTEPTPIKPSTPKSFTPKPLIPLYVKKKDAFDEFLENAARETFSLTAMFFQDAWSIDLERLEGCCVHIFAPPDRFVPFCAMNLTSADGQALHRGHRETLEP